MHAGLASFCEPDETAHVTRLAISGIQRIVVKRRNCQRNYASGGNVVPGDGRRGALRLHIDLAQCVLSVISHKSATRIFVAYRQRRQTSK